jgi:hypothetical protein
VNKFLMAGVALGLTAVLLLAAADRSLRDAEAGLAVSPGPDIEIGAITVDSGNIVVPVITTGTGFDPYVGFNARLLWDPAIFAFSSFNSTGTVINFAFCVPPFTGADPDGGGIIVACAALGAPTTTTGLLGTIVLAPVGVGCSNLHLFTFGPPDGGDGTTGTYTLDEDSQPQDNAYGPDKQVDNLGQACTLVEETPTPEPTDTPVPTATNTPEPTDTPVPSPTNTPVPPTNTPVPSPTNTAVPSPTNTAVPSPTNTAVPPTATPTPDAPVTGAPPGLVLARNMVCTLLGQDSQACQVLSALVARYG